MSVRRIFAALLLSGLFVYPALAAEFQFGSLLLQWPEGFVAKSTTPPFELGGPNGTTVLVTVMRQRNEPPAPGNPEAQQEMARVGEGFLLRQAEKTGAVVVPIARSALENGTLVRRIASESKGLFSSRYFVQFLLVSPTGRLGFITIEGTGSAEAELSRYIGYVESAKWVD